MKFKSTSYNSTKEILKRKLGGELFKEIKLADGAFTNGVCAAGNPIDANGNKVNGAAATYKASTDTSVTSGKAYYTKSGDVYTAVTSPTGNPSTSSYYEVDKAADANPVGILLYDVLEGNPNGTIVAAFADINTANCNSNTGITIADSVKSTLSLMKFE